ncbi:hypothetical protein DFJ74DRAFT_647002 [Hyaloraphidium curvatum]|nr:hypothetical protein DFJ74DRAFT_647002 [Hyaloraphidium curvatum]
MSAREAVSNAVASIVLDLMRVSKRTHFLRLEHVCQILHDNNGPILILKLLSTWFQPRTDAAQAYPGPQTVTDAPADVDAAAGSGLAGLPKWLQRRVTPEDLCTFPVGAAPEDELVPHRRNLSTSCLLLGALHHLTKRRPTRIAALVQWKASAVLKRILRVEHDELRVRALKILKSQLPYLGKKWRNANMRVITAIYLHLGLDFAELTDRDEPSGTDGEPVSADDEVLRSVVSFYHSRRFPYITGAQKDAAAPYLPDVNLAWNLNGPQVAFHDDIELPDPAVLDRPLPWWPPVDCNDFADSRHEVTRPPATG